jgi:hypothetical protein
VSKNNFYDIKLPYFLKPKKNFELIRLGKNYDGGYLIDANSIKNTKTLLSLGIGDDWSFEEDFRKKNNKIKILCYDDTTNLYFIIRLFVKKFILILNYNIKEAFLSFINIFKYIFFFRKVNIYKKRITYGDLLTITKKLKGPIFIKIDIEGSEYKILDDILKINKKLSGLIIEFHSIDLFMDKIKEFVSKIDLELTHIHANNGSLTINEQSIIEVTFSKYPLLCEGKLKFPNNKDQKNFEQFPEIRINFAKEKYYQKYSKFLN